MSESFAVDVPLTAAVRLSAGRVDVRATDAGRAVVTVQPVDPAHEESVRAAAQTEIRLEGDQLRVDVPDNRLFRRAEVAITLELPTGSGLSVRAGAADVAVTGAVADLVVRNGSGDVTVDTATSVVVKSGQTSVQVGSTDTVTVTTGQGSLRADRVGDATFKTGHGDVQLGATAGAVVVKGGAVQLRVREAGAGELVFDTGSGSAVVGVVPGTTVQVDLTSGSGAVRCDVPLESSAPTGGAALRMRLRTGSGDLRVLPTGAGQGLPVAG